jgi:hypothetical protein
LLVSREKNCETSCINFKPEEKSFETKIFQSKQKVSSVEENLQKFREIVHFLENLIEVRKSNHEISSKKNARDAQIRFPNSKTKTLAKEGNGNAVKIDERVESSIECHSILGTTKNSTTCQFSKCSNYKNNLFNNFQERQK